MNQTKKQSYDAVIVGAGIAGQSCAKTLADSDLSVLLIDSNPKFEEKPCAGGFTLKDQKYIPKKYSHMPLQKAHISFQNKNFATTKPFVASFDRKKYLKESLNEIVMHINITTKIPCSLKAIEKNSTVLLSDNSRFSYKYLIGADGSNSVVRKHLDLPSNNYWIGIQHYIDSKENNFELELDENIGGYFWIFPHNNFSSVGVGAYIKTISPALLREYLDKFIAERGFRLIPKSFQSTIINCDYRGYKFGNIYLAGDAAGLVPSLTGKGIYAANLSGELIGKEILGKMTPIREFRKHLMKKRIMDLFGKLLLNKITRKAFFKFGINFIQNSLAERLVFKVAR